MKRKHNNPKKQKTKSPVHPLQITMTWIRTSIDKEKTQFVAFFFFLINNGTPVKKKDLTLHTFLDKYVSKLHFDVIYRLVFQFQARFKLVVL